MVPLSCNSSNLFEETYIDTLSKVSHYPSDSSVVANAGMKGVMSTHSTYAQMDNYFHEYRVEYLANCASEESYATPVHQVYHGLHLNRFPP